MWERGKGDMYIGWYWNGIREIAEKRMVEGWQSHGSEE